jgi:hypothetical protein
MEAVSKRPLEWLRERSREVLVLNSSLREVFTGIADQAGSPTAASDLAEANARNRGFSPGEAIELAKSTRWLAIILRDYGREEFDKTIGR